MLFVFVLTLILSQIQGFPANFDLTSGETEIETWNYKVEEIGPILNATLYNHTLPEKSHQTSGQLLWEFNKNENVFGQTLSIFNFNSLAEKVQDSLLMKVSCTGCVAGAGLLQHAIKTNKSKDEIKEMVYKYCVSLKIQSDKVCRGVVTVFADEMIHVLKRITAEPIDICENFLSEFCGASSNPAFDWDILFPPIQKPIPIPQRLPQENAPTFKVLHLSDIHLDPEYLEGSNTDCGEPLCCRASNGPASSKDKAAGKWGSYKSCDTPQATVENMLQHIEATHPDLDYIILTGDIPPHDVWNQTRAKNLQTMNTTLTLLKAFFPKIPIFAALGNHESAPVNSFAPLEVEDSYSIGWLYDELARHWSAWLPGEAVRRSVRVGAFYSVLVRPGFRLISLNTNYCNNKNWWLLLNGTDPAQELQWFVYELQAAELNKEKVHVIGHIPPGYPDCLKVWSRNYYTIINRFESTITAQFFGHTHFDEFEVFYDHHDLLRPINVAYVGPSVTPYFDLNPGYRIYYVDGDHPKTTRSIVDYETWTMNLREANLYGYPIWFQLYSARHAFEMEALRPGDWDFFIDRMRLNPKLFQLFYKYYYRASPVKPSCNKSCKKKILCDLRSGRSYYRESLCSSKLRYG